MINNLRKHDRAFSYGVKGNKLWFPEIADIPVLQKTYRGTIFFLQNRNIPIYRLYRPYLSTVQTDLGL